MYLRQQAGDGVVHHSRKHRSLKKSALAKINSESILSPRAAAVAAAAVVNAGDANVDDDDNDNDDDDDDDAGGNNDNERAARATRPPSSAAPLLATSSSSTASKSSASSSNAAAASLLAVGIERMSSERVRALRVVELDARERLTPTATLAMRARDATSSTRVLRDLTRQSFRDTIEILKPLGCGSYGVVLLVRHRATQRLLAMKKISKRRLIDSRQVDQVWQVFNCLFVFFFCVRSSLVRLLIGYNRKYYYFVGKIAIDHCTSSSKRNTCRKERRVKLLNFTTIFFFYSLSLSSSIRSTTKISFTFSSNTLLAVNCSLA